MTEAEKWRRERYESEKAKTPEVREKSDKVKFETHKLAYPLNC